MSNTNSGCESETAAGASGPVENGAADAEHSPRSAAPDPARTLIIAGLDVGANGSVRGFTMEFAAVDRVVTTSGRVLKEKNYTFKIAGAEK